MLEFVVYLPLYKIFKLRFAVILKDVLKHQHCGLSEEISGCRFWSCFAGNQDLDDHNVSPWIKYCETSEAYILLSFLIVNIILLCN